MESEFATNPESGLAIGKIIQIAASGLVLGDAGAYADAHAWLKTNLNRIFGIYIRATCHSYCDRFSQSITIHFGSLRSKVGTARKIATQNNPAASTTIFRSFCGLLQTREVYCCPQRS